MTSLQKSITVGVIWLLAATAAQAHFVFVLPDENGAQARVILNETLEPSGQVDVGIAGATKLHLRDAHGDDHVLTLERDENAFKAALPGSGTRVIHGMTDLGLMNRGKMVLLLYYPKAIVGDAFDAKTEVGESAAVEIIPVGKAGDLKLRLVAGGEPQADAEVTVLLPDGSSKIVKTDADGHTEAFTQTGRYGAWARHWEDQGGERDGETYEQTRHYAMLVFDADGEEASAKRDRFTPMPEAASSFGSVVSDGWLYVYGGHVSPTHVYHTEGVSGRFARTSLDGDGGWEELPGGPGLQGFNLTAHGGLVYRVGGMAPRNAEGEKSDNHSVADVARFHPKKGKWEALPDLPAPRSSHDVVVLDGDLYVIGGWTMQGGEGPTWAETMLRMDLSKKTLKWESVAAPFRRRALMAAALKGKVYVVGGFSDENQIIHNVSVYDPKTDGWTEVAKLPEDSAMAGFSPAVGTHAGQLYVSVADGTLFRLSETGEAWEELGNGTPRVAHRMAFRGDQALVMGGAGDGQNYDLVEAFSVAEE